MDRGKRAQPRVFSRARAVRRRRGGSRLPAGAVTFARAGILDCATAAREALRQRGDYLDEPLCGAVEEIISSSGGGACR